MARKITVEIVGDAKKLNRTLNETQTRTSKMGTAAKAAGVAIAGGLAVGLEQSVKAAIHAQTSQARLEQAFKNQKIAIDPLKSSIDKLEESGRQLGFTDEETKNALGSLVTATGSYKDSVNQLSIAQDLARFKSVDLESAVKALTMAHAGSLRPIKQLGIDIPKVTTAQDALKAAAKAAGVEVDAHALAMAKAKDKAQTFANVLQTVTDKVGGQAKKFSDTTQGAMERYKAQMDHIKVEIGKVLLPAFTQVLDGLDKQAGAFDKLKEKYKFQIDQLKTITPLFANITYFIGILVGAVKDLSKWLGKLNIDWQHQIAPIMQTYHAIQFVVGVIETLIADLKWIIEHSHIKIKIDVPGSGILGGIKKRVVGASGGIVTQPTFAMIGEAGPEAVIPLNRTAGSSPLGAMGGGTAVINLQVDGATLASVLFDPFRNKVTQVRRAGGSF